MNIRDLIYALNTRDASVAILLDDITSKTPLTIQMTDHHEDSTNEISFSFDRLNEAERLAKEILEQVSYLRAVRKRSDDLSAMFVKMAKNAQAKILVNE